ncbi:MAG: 4Fe-4S binding protein [Anaerolineales bacterium]|nr:4Fe-4S binding protein [Anaerolineales bacterium]
MTQNPYKQLAARLDALPNGFPATASGVELRLLAALYAPEEAALAARLRVVLETPAQLAARLGGETAELAATLKNMTRRGLIRAGRADGGVGYGLLPFVVGIYEAQLGQIDAELAALFEAYYHEAFGQLLAVQPPVHRVIPIGESIPVDMEVHPYESAAGLLNAAQSWGVIDCVCRKQKALIGEPCDHPVDVCLLFNERPGAFDGHPKIRALTHDEAAATLQRAADAGLVHTVSNNQQGLHYVCNCCTCSCGILRGIADLGMANVVARSAFVNQVDASLCNGCENCVERCQFNALALNADFVMQVDERRCVGCGVCVTACDEAALTLVRRPAGEVKPPPRTIFDWGMQRAAVRGLDLRDVL